MLAALVSGRVIAEAAVTVPLGRAVAAVLWLSGVMAAQQLSAIAAAPLREATARAIDGRFRRDVAESAMLPTGIAHLDDPQLADRLALASRDLDHFTPGNAAAAQIGVLCQGAAAVGCAGIIALHAPLWAALLLVLALLRRLAIQRLFVGLNWLKIRSADTARRFRHWQSFAAEPAAAKEIRVFGLKTWITNGFRQSVTAYFTPLWRARIPVIYRTWVPLAIGTCIVIGTLAVLVPRHGSASPTTVAQGLIALGTVFNASAMTWNDFEVAHGRPMIEAARELRSELSAPTADSPHSAATSAPPTTVRFENVRFRYPRTDGDVLTNLDLELRAGEILAVVGVNGAGKSTTIKLLARLHEPTTGRIVVGGTPITDIPVDSWRQRLAVVTQGFLKYDLTLRENVMLGAPERQDDALFRAVAESLNLGDIVDRLPLGWETPLSRSRTGGVDLSGGQWQRVAIARAIYALQAGRSILILDEPTAHLDAEAEFDVFKTIIDHAAGASILLVSHRLATVRLAHRIAVLHNGRVAELGSHDALIARDGAYARMFKAQARRFLEAR